MTAKFWQPKNNEWNNFMIYFKDNKTIGGSIVHTPIKLNEFENEIIIWLSHHKSFEKDFILKTLLYFKNELFKMSNCLNDSIIYRFKVYVWKNNQWELI